NRRDSFWEKLKGGVSELLHVGKAPKNATRADSRVRDDVCDALTYRGDLDATDIDVTVHNGEVTLEGTVQTRSMKHHAENLADEVTGVKDVHNHLRVTTGLLTEIKDKVSGQEKERHYANSGTRDKPANGTA
ncbi:MAG TPA: BON domain-containing protein, partial [Polyangiaceae bacterium]|nr:BON domain-containing protein [Polyangiaceae bacterium]